MRRAEHFDTRPLLPIELHYMITAWSKDTRGELAIAGRVLQVLYDRQILGPADLPGDSWEPDESVQLLFESLPIEEHYRVWGTTDVPYRLSLTYMARGVGIAPIEASRFAPVVQAGDGAEADHRPSVARAEAHVAGRATRAEASGFLTYCGAERQYRAQLNRVSA